MWGASIVAFGFMHLAPIDPVRFMLGFRQGTRESQIYELRQWYGLDDPLPAQYLRWMGHVLQGDFGRSLATRREIAPEIWRRLPWSLLLATSSAVLSWGVAVPLAVVAARGGPPGHVGTGVATVGRLIPTFLVATLLVYLFAVRLTWIPILPPFELDLFDRTLWSGLLLPTISLALPLAAVLAAQMRLDLRAILQEPYIAAARARGLPERRIMWRHAARVAARAFLVQPLLMISVLMGSLLIVEEIFNWPGIGRIFMRGMAQRDIPVIQALVLVLSALVVACDSLVRLAAGRVRLSPEAATIGRTPEPQAGRAAGVRAPDLQTRIAVAAVAALVIAAVAAPLVVRFPPDQVLLDEINVAPSARHWLGTDSSGRDMWSRAIHASRVSLGMSAVGAAAAVLVGLALAWPTIAGPAPWQGRVAAAVDWAARVIISVPAIALAMALLSVTGREPMTIIAIFTVIGIASVAAAMRALLATARRWPFVEAAVASGARPMWVGERHLLTHLIRPVLATMAGLVPGFLVLEATLGFLGFSVTPTVTTWGTLLWRGREALHRGDWWLLLFPALFLVVATWAFHVISEALDQPPPPTYVKMGKPKLGKEWGRAGAPAAHPVAAPTLAAGLSRKPAPGRSDDLA